jgi:hypothetical protein
MTTNKITAYKAFNQDWTCRDFKYEMGKTYTHDGEVEACKSGFHSCEYPLDIFNYYAPCTSKFALVEASGFIHKENSDSKIASKVLELKQELDINSLVKASIRHTISQTIESGSNHATGYRAASSATGDGAASSATGTHAASSATGTQAASSATGYQAASSATGYGAASSATGDRAASSATGARAASSATGDRAASLATGSHSSSEVLENEFTQGNGSAIATGYASKVRAPLGCALFLVERDSKTGTIINVWSGIVGKNNIKPNTWYMIKDGEPMEVTE